MEPMGVVDPNQVPVLVNQPLPSGLMVTSMEGQREWSTGLFDIFSDMKSCLFTFLFHPVAQCMIAKRMGEFACLPHCAPGSTIAVRTKIRTVGGIRGTICNDCLTSAFCGPCATCQESRELDRMGVP